ncbi:MAG: hypothetical protein J5988_14390, partial [Eubacterium sp.]|nr:hypothetical protein [Eubacterium sp.]
MMNETGHVFIKTVFTLFFQRENNEKYKINITYLTGKCKEKQLLTVLKGKFLHSLPCSSKFTYSDFFMKFKKLSTSIDYTSAPLFLLVDKF